MILSGELATEEAVSRFYTEARAAATLDHPGIVPVHEIGMHDGKHYFAMGYVEGRSLAEQLKIAPLSIREAVVLTSKIAQAVALSGNAWVSHDKNRIPIELAVKQLARYHHRLAL